MTRRDDLNPARGVVYAVALGVLFWLVVAAIAGAIYR